MRIIRRYLAVAGRFSVRNNARGLGAVRVARRKCAKAPLTTAEVPEQGRRDEKCSC